MYNIWYTYNMYIRKLFILPLSQYSLTQNGSKLTLANFFPCDFTRNLYISVPYSFLYTQYAEVINNNI